jgi:hypothetical protein
MNNSFTNDAKIALRIGAATVGLHPADAAERGLAEGDADMGRSTAVHSIEVTVTPARHPARVSSPSLPNVH